MTQAPFVPAYFDRLIAARRRGLVGRFVHLGHWDAPSSEAVDEFERAQARLNAVLLEMAELRAGQAVLDVGCGFGGTLDAANRALAGMSLTGVNIDARQIEICREITPLNRNRLRWMQADACELPFPEGSFDRVLCIEAMFHFASRRAFFEQAARVLKPGGVLVASDMVLTDSARRIGVPPLCIEAPIQDGFGPWPDFWGRDADHRALGRAAGLRCTTWRDATESTLPSHRFTTPSAADEFADPGDATVRAALVLRWLHSSGHLRYLYMRFDRDFI